MHIETDATQHLQRAAHAARAASHTLARSSAAQRNAALHAMAAALRAQAPAILAANAADLAASTGTAAFRDRLALNEARVEAMARGLEDVAALPDPLDRVLADWTRPNGLRIQRIATPIGVIGMIYESRPNVGADAAGAVPQVRQRGDPARRLGKHCAARRRSTRRWWTGCARPGCRRPACRSPPTPTAPMSPPCWPAAGLLDLIIPRGGKSLVERVQREARVPVLAHAEGLCHTYVHAAADPAMARAHRRQREDAPHRRSAAPPKRC